MAASDDIKGRLDIVDVVSGYVALKKAGRSYKALCPFHTEKTPSFVVNPERQSWHCFGACGTGGDLITFVMRTERLQFGEAIRALAEKAGITIGERPDSGRSETSYRLNKLAAEFYRDVLKSSEGRAGLNYLTERGLDERTISTFQLGVSPKGGNRLKSFFQTHEIGIDAAIEAGLLHRTEDGSVRDFFWGRLMFPIHDRQGRVAGLGARTLDGSMPKYLNTASTSIFDKRSMLYGLHLAAGIIREQDTAVVVEGYMDAIAAHQHGYANVVASMGTALTEQQVSKLKPMATTFVLALDPDAAGQEATLRSLDSSWRVIERQRVAGVQRAVGPLYQREQLDLKIASLPSGVDPDELIRRDPKEWERVVDEGVPYMEYMIQSLPSRFDLTAPDGKSQAAEAMGPLITSTGDSIKQEHYFHKLGLALDLNADTLKASFRERRPTDARARRVWQAPKPERPPALTLLSSGREDVLEDYVLALLLARPELKEHVGSLTPEQFQNTEDREVFTGWLGCSTMDELQSDLDPSLHEHLQHLLDIELAPTDRPSAEAALAQCVRRMEERQLRELQASILESESVEPPPRELEEAVVGVNVRLKESFSQRT